MSLLCRNFILSCSAAAAVMAVLAPVELTAAPAQTPAKAEQKAAPKKIDWRPFTDNVNAAIKSKDPAKFDAAIKAIEDQDPDTVGKTGTLIRAVNSKRDPMFSVQYFQKKIQEAGENKGEWEPALLNAYASLATAQFAEGKQNEFAGTVKIMETMPDTIRGKNDIILRTVTGNPFFAETYLAAIKPANDREKAKLDEMIFRNNENMAVYYAKAGDRENFDKVLKKIEDMPKDTPNRIASLTSLAKYVDSYSTRDYLENLYKQTNDPAEQYLILSELRSTVPLQARPYGFVDKENYQLHKSYWLRQQALIAAEEKLDAKERKVRGRRGIMTSAAQAADFWNQAVEFGDFKFADELLDTWYKGVGDKDVNCAIARMKTALIKHDAATAKAISQSEAVNELRAKLNDPKTTNEHLRRILKSQLNELTGLAVFVEKMDFPAFSKAVFGDVKPSSAELYLALSHASYVAFNIGRHDIAQAITKEIYDNMFIPGTRLTFQVSYDADCPKTADAWMRSKYSDWSKLDTRFKLYASYFEDSHDLTIKKLLKDEGKEPEVPAENRAGVQFLYDTEALHIFVRVNDAQAHEITEGLHKGPSFEMLFRAGKDVVYNSDYLLETPNTEQTFPQDWMRPGLDYTLTKDFIRRDIVVTDNDITVHYAIPFSTFFDKLPVNGREWTFGLQVWGKSALTLSCGVVHELSRMGLLDIKFAPEQMTGIKRVILRKAFNHAMYLYNRQGSLPRLWADDVVGDPEFYNQEVKQLFDTLLEANKKFAEVKDSEIDEWYEKYVQLGMKLEYIVAAKRAEYIRNSLLK